MVEIPNHLLPGQKSRCIGKEFLLKDPETVLLAFQGRAVVTPVSLTLVSVEISKTLLVHTYENSAKKPHFPGSGLFNEHELKPHDGIICVPLELIFEQSVLFYQLFTLALLIFFVKLRWFVIVVHWVARLRILRSYSGLRVDVG